MTAEQILAAIALAESLLGAAVSAYSDVRNAIDAKTDADIAAAITRTGALLDAATTQLDADAS